MADVKAELGYYDNQPVICLRPRVERTSNKGRAFLIGMNQLHEYSEDHNQSFEAHIFRICNKIYKIFDLGQPNTRKLAEIASLIQSRIDDLLKMPPMPSETRTVAEAKVKAAGNEFDHEIREKVNGGYIQYTSG